MASEATIEGVERSGRAVAQTQWRLILRHFMRHKLAVIGLWALAAMYLVGVVLPDFFAPYGAQTAFKDTYLPPQPVRFVDAGGRFHLHPFVYNWVKQMDPQTWQMKYLPDTTRVYPLRLFVRGDAYKLLGLIPGDRHIVGVDQGGRLHFLGTDHLGRDLLSRILLASQVSLTIGFLGVFISLVLGLLFGGISGLVGGTVDDVIQRVIETLLAIPKLPLWMALAAAVPKNWSAIQVYFAITIILSLMGWTGLARVVRSKFISLREEDFVNAARGYNASTLRIIGRHLVPNFVSYIIVNLTLAIPQMILAETSLSFLGIGLRAPVVSLGVLLEKAQSLQTVALFPWLLTPGLVVVIAVLAFNFVGDGLRDAADPYR
jgi:peptide/nickel transport system permease protein